MVRPLLPYSTQAGFWLCFFCVTNSFSVQAQGSEPSNSFQTYYQSQIPSLRYAYSESLQTHNYSGNWDLDEDGQLDSLWFVGTGGAHLYFYLSAMLSTENKIREYPFLQTDFPQLAFDSTGTSIPPNHLSKEKAFAVVNFGVEEGLGIFISLDQSSFQAAQKKLAQKGIQTNGILLRWKDGNEKWSNWQE